MLLMEHRGSRQPLANPRTGRRGGVISEPDTRHAASTPLCRVLCNAKYGPRRVATRTRNYKTNSHKGFEWRRLGNYETSIFHAPSISAANRANRSSDGRERLFSDAISGMRNVFLS